MGGVGIQVGRYVMGARHKSVGEMVKWHSVVGNGSATVIQ